MRIFGFDLFTLLGNTETIGELAFLIAFSIVKKSKMLSLFLMTVVAFLSLWKNCAESFLADHRIRTEVLTSA